MIKLTSNMHLFYFKLISLYINGRVLLYAVVNEKQKIKMSIMLLTKNNRKAIKCKCAICGTTKYKL